MAETAAVGATEIGPSRGELKLRLAISLGGLAMMAGALVFRGVPTGPTFVEVVVIAGAFFGGSAAWTARRLWRSDTQAARPDDQRDEAQDSDRDIAP